MAEDQENIEAQLCAYIDGELDAKGRAEIEKHLANNPQHQKLIAGLIGSREMLRSLPREKAPEDIAETIQHSLERSVLLDNIDDDGVSMPMRIRPRSHVMLKAAIVLLTIGLGVVVYFVLPPLTKQGEYAIVPPAPRRAPVGATTSRMDDIARKEVTATATPKLEGVASKAVNRDIFAASTGTAEKSAPSKADVAFNSGDGESGKRGIDEGNQFLVVVNTDNPTATNGQVTHYLVSNGIAWQEVTEPMPGPVELGANQVVDMSRLQNSKVQLQSAENTFGGNTSTQQKDKVALGEPKQSPATQTIVVAEALSDQKKLNLDVNSQSITRSTRGRYVANMTRQQAADLSSTLQNSRAGQQAMFYDKSVADLEQSARIGGGNTTVSEVDEQGRGGSGGAYSFNSKAASHPYQSRALASTNPDSTSGGINAAKPALSPAAVMPTPSTAPLAKQYHEQVVLEDVSKAPGGAKMEDRRIFATTRPAEAAANVSQQRQALREQEKPVEQQIIQPAGQPSAAQQSTTQAASQPAAAEPTIDVVIVVNEDPAPTTEPSEGVVPASPPTAATRPNAAQ